jgi:hypothetical protein
MPLPFISQPKAFLARRVGNEATGTLDIPLQYGITVAEDDTITSLMPAPGTLLTQVAPYADAIAKAEGITSLEAMKVLEGRWKNDERMAEIALRHADALEAVSRIYSDYGQAKILASVTAIIRHRLKESSWSMDDTRGLPRALRDAIWAIVQEEEASEMLPSTPVTEADMGKQQPEPIARRPSTGGKSSGHSRKGAPVNSRG